MLQLRIEQVQIDNVLAPRPSRGVGSAMAAISKSAAAAGRGKSSATVRRRREQEAGMKLGEPLPRNGACTHYSKVSESAGCLARCPHTRSPRRVPAWPAWPEADSWRCAGCGVCGVTLQSLRWLRFPCCGRAFPCDVCHEQATGGSAGACAELPWANRMICGMCAFEQVRRRM
jgi:hypothetical protein